MADKHKEYKATYKNHVKVGAYDGGACLVGHESSFKDDDSCSYRWQGVHKASAGLGRAALDANSNPNFRFAGRGDAAFKDPAAAKASPGMGGVFVTLSASQIYSIVKVNNFTTGMKPYSNQVHHVLPTGTLRNGIDDVAKIWSPVRGVIVDGLLDEKYNINHHDNMLILPSVDKHCRETGLPKHLGSHPGYDVEIKTAVTAAMKPYRAVANKMKKQQTHPPLDPESLKDQLVAISNTMYANIVGLAAGNRATQTLMTINTLPPAAFAGL